MRLQSDDRVFGGYKDEALSVGDLFPPMDRCPCGSRSLRHVGEIERSGFGGIVP